ncbi:MAG: hypothetical protein EOS58_27015 [Mesorhizobium sp.]|uniref:hypothetical protein n=1 Tax=unclassified Mesorhizobium TaxID=325217 RepID=UPI000F75A8F9|nr:MULTISPECIES: hypothetical protein [unclassified Mesorhizobium]AZO47729.1 hypothetical protein EJ073_07735 [Mesorhizobium sp. M4B.F.Ca.ET.058.02.1.1]RUX45508.1 hypothetical protein EOA33_23860 [Mesorhizobium sp. M4A.F.Ca.ET.050.02.1.1]RVC44575.1 hypothetical protein EN781_13475 [Mesorhizobium sp. M4A.F.Ca.ET.090.04.2.1]RVD39722.1 hypothetical protein EN742_14440 [Mesorhizobium sp. M4A.F.Ca.ET.020.02.1.1]RWC18841.1 MAG: hypothetical protein EOS53_15400 [Mesorhizobium sp.]
MTMRILAATMLTLGLGTSAMAQTAGDTAGSGMVDGSGKSVVVDPTGPNTVDLNDPDAVDPTPTYSIDGMATYATSPTPDQNCPVGPQGAQPDASGTSPGTSAPTVNDNHCGK